MADKFKRLATLAGKDPRVTYGDAYTRLTRTPVHISDPYALLRVLRDEGFGAYWEDEGQKSQAPQHRSPTGTYDPRTKDIEIHLDPATQTPSWEANEAIGHEATHAALDEAGYGGYGTTGKGGKRGQNPPTPMFGVMNALMGLDNPEKAARFGMDTQHRGGDPSHEVPAYVTASPRYLGPDFTEDMRQLYLKQFEHELPPDVAKLIQRIADNYTGSLKSPGFVTSGEEPRYPDTPGVPRGSRDRKRR